MAMQKGEGANVPLLVGSNADEGTMFILAMPLLVPGVLLPLNEDGFRKVLMRFFSSNTTTVDGIFATYPASAYADTDARAAAVLRDYVFTCSSRRAARAVATHAPNTAFQYEFVHKPSWIDAGILGVYHSLELPFVFGNEWPIIVHGFSPEDRKVSQAIGTYWASFVRNLVSPRPAQGRVREGGRGSERGGEGARGAVKEV